MPDVPWGSVPVSLDFLANEDFSNESFGDHLFPISTGPNHSLTTSLRRRMPSVSELQRSTANSFEARRLRSELELAFLGFYFWMHIAPGPLTIEQRNLIISALGIDGGFSVDSINTVLQWHQDGLLTRRIQAYEHLVERRRRDLNSTEQLMQQNAAATDIATTMHPLEGRETATDADNEPLMRGETASDDTRENGREGQSLLNLLYRIAEDQARKDGYVHRGVICNSCSAMPIKGIRYRCSNCVDFDLCEECEAMQIHPKTHLFYKVRIPAPFLGNYRQPQPVWYPGRPALVTQDLSKDAVTMFCKETGYQMPEVEALWEQFRCLAATEWEEDPGLYKLAIDRRTFDKCFVPNTSIRPPPPNLIYDRAFSFYDSNSDGLIGFEEFMMGRATLAGKNQDERWERVFRGYDINNDGFVDRKDFLRMFRAYYALTKELTRDLLTGMEDDVSESGARDIVLGSQPISSAFTGAISRPAPHVTSEGKVRDRWGDDRIYDDQGAVDEEDHEVEEPSEIIADATEAARFGNVQRKDLIGTWIGDVVYDGPWPPKYITEADVQKVLKDETDPYKVMSPQDQYAIRRAAHGRIARNHQERGFVRRHAIRNRQQRQIFYDDTEGAAPPQQASLAKFASKFDVASEYQFWHTHRSGTARQWDKARTANLRRVLESSMSDEFRTSLIKNIESLHWPVDSSEKLANEVIQMVEHGWTGSNIIEDLSGYGSEGRDSIDFISSFDAQINEAIKTMGPGEPADEQLESLPSSRRSRSSSKVRFRDDVETDDEHEVRSQTSMSSRSIPVNERWGGLEMPEPEKDVGREVLYQVTQEALNELLDPVFRLREDLALAAMRTETLRDRYRAEIIASVVDPIKIKRYLDVYQRRWRLGVVKDQEAKLHGSLGTREVEEMWGADEFSEFMSMSEAGDLNRRTGEQCTRCELNGVKTWIWAGGFCKECSNASAEAWEDENNKSDKPPIACMSCGKEGLRHGEYCSQCGEPSPNVSEEKEKLWEILRGVQEGDESRTANEAVDPKLDGTEDQASSSYSEATQDIQSSAAALEDASAFEEAIAQKPLHALIAESDFTTENASNGANVPSQLPRQTPSTGSDSYAVFTPRPWNASSPPDPTLPQNRPNMDKTSGSNLMSALLQNTSNEALPATNPNSSARPDPTLPQNRPNTVQEAEAQRSSSLEFPADNNPEHLVPRVSMAQLLTEHHRVRQLNEKPKGKDEPPPDAKTLMFYAAMDMLEAEDEERGGPGRLSFKEWHEVMKGDKGAGLGFLGSWIEIASF